MRNTECPVYYTEKDVEALISVVPGYYKKENDEMEERIPLIPSLKTSLLFFAAAFGGLGVLLMMLTVIDHFLA